MKKRILDEMNSSFPSCRQRLVKKRHVDESLLERLWLLPEVGQTYIEPCLCTIEHATVSRTCQNLSKVVANARSFIFDSPTSKTFDEFLRYVNRTPTFPQLQRISINFLYNNCSVSPRLWILDASRFPKLQQIEAFYCQSIKLVLKDDLKPRVVVDVFDFQCFLPTIEISTPQSLISYTVSDHKGLRNTLTKTQGCIRNLILFSKNLIYSDLKGPIPREIYNSLESLNIIFERDFSLAKQQSSYVLPYPISSTMFVHFFYILFSVFCFVFLLLFFLLLFFLFLSFHFPFFFLPNYVFPIFCVCVQISYSLII